MNTPEIRGLAQSDATVDLKDSFSTLDGSVEQLATIRIFENCDCWLTVSFVCDDVDDDDDVSDKSRCVWSAHFTLLFCACREAFLQVVMFFFPKKVRLE